MIGEKQKYLKKGYWKEGRIMGRKRLYFSEIDIRKAKKRADIKYRNSEKGKYKITLYNERRRTDPILKQKIRDSYKRFYWNNRDRLLRERAETSISRKIKRILRK